MKLIYLDPTTQPDKIPCYRDTGTDYIGFAQHTHSQAEISYVASGQLIDTYPETVNVLETRQLCLVRSADIHSTQPINPCTIDLYTINIPQAVFNKFLEYYNLDPETFLIDIPHPKVTVSPDEHIRFLKMFRRLSENRFDAKHGNLMRQLFADIIYLFTDPEIKTENQVLPPWFSQLMFDMSLPTNFIAGLPRLNELANYSKEYISRCFKKYLNVTPTEYINNLRLDYAATMLASTDKGVLEVYLAAGFQNEGHFYKLFNERFHMSPVKYKKLKTAEKKNTADEADTTPPPLNLP